MAGKGFLTGAALGAAVAYLFNTKKGKKIRHDLKKRGVVRKAVSVFKKTTKLARRKKHHRLVKRRRAA